MTAPILNTPNALHSLAQRLFPIARSLTGPGVRESLAILKEFLPNLRLAEVPSGTQCFDWVVPSEWVPRSGKLWGPSGELIADFGRNNLELVGYSQPFKGELSLEELQSHLFSIPEMPQAIPYITSYYSPFWGFCLPHAVRSTLKSGRYRVEIDTEHRQGVLNYADLVIPATVKSGSAKEILFSTYVCHPSMANNELSGPVVATALAQWVQTLAERKYAYRFVFIPETIGSIVYISKHHKTLTQNVAAGFVLTCIGDDGPYSYLESRRGDTLTDKIGRALVLEKGERGKIYSYKERGSDERQYCSPGVDLPVGSLMRSKYATYPQYHTSLDDLSFVTPSGLAGGLEFAQAAVTILEQNYKPKVLLPCEPQLGKRGLYPSISTRESTAKVARMMDFLAYADGTNDLLDLARISGAPIQEILQLTRDLVKAGVITKPNDSKGMDA